MCDVTVHIHHRHVSLSLKYITSESTIYKEFHTILLSKINIKISVTFSPVQNLPHRSPPAQPTLNQASVQTLSCTRLNQSSSAPSTRSTLSCGDSVQQSTLSSRLQRRYIPNSVSLLGDIGSLCGKYFEWRHTDTRTI